MYNRIIYQKRYYCNKIIPKVKNYLISTGLNSAYDPQIVENDWYNWWSENKLFTIDSSNNNENSIDLMILPPPNVTGALHIGHALTNSIQDSLVRYYRMKNKNIVWLPGLDHAGIATQTVVEQDLLKQGIKKSTLSREDFIKYVWKWKDKYGQRINSQQKLLGSSLDWSNEYFTLDKIRSTAVTEAFVQLYDAGLIERRARMINWDCHLLTTISDIEVDYIDVEPMSKMSLPGYDDSIEVGVMHHIAYRIDEPTSNAVKEIIVSTTRIETMFGDVAIAVHPDDIRYKELHGNYVVQPITNRKLPIILDKELVNPKLGSGAVKITPFHDFNDFDCGERHNLPMIKVINENGKLTEAAGEFCGQDRFLVRSVIIERLKELDAYRGKNGHSTRIAICSRSKNILEPLLKDQWFVNVESMAKNAIKSLESGQITLWPLKSIYNQYWKEFLSKTKHWCISRQLWWGHRIPAYKIKWINNNTNTNEWIVGRNIDEAKEKLILKYNLKTDNDFELHQDDDVLDTWFSSALLPLSCQNWPNNENKSIKPLKLMETGGDILFFWVARMVMLCSELNNKQLPFNHIYLHPMICDANGQKMSKSKGNVIDPLHIINGVSLDDLIKQLYDGNLPRSEIERAKNSLTIDFPDGIPQCGSDALRYTLCNYARGGQSINLDVKRVHHYRLFCNKIYQACRFVVGQLRNCKQIDDYETDLCYHTINQWILSRLARCIILCEESFEEMNVANITDNLYNFFQMEFCDEYIEYSKALLRSKDVKVVETTRYVLFMIMEVSLRLFHPFLPFLTEELWQSLRYQCNHFCNSKHLSIMVTSYPNLNDLNINVSEPAETSVCILRSIIQTSRSALSRYNDLIDRKQIFLHGKNSKIIYDNFSPFLKNMLKLENVIITDQRNTDESIVWEHISISIPISSTTIDKDMLYIGYKIINSTALKRSINRLKRKLKKVNTQYKKLLATTQNELYEVNVPKHIQQRHQDNLKQLNKDMDEIEMTIQSLEMLEVID